VHQYRLGADLLKRSSAEKDVGILVDSRLAMNRQGVDELELRKFHTNTRKNLFSVRVTEH